jgi:hypothetical protein
MKVFRITPPTEGAAVVTDERFQLSLSSQEYDSVYFALRAYMDNLAKDIKAQVDKLEDQRTAEMDAEEYTFLGLSLHQTANIAFAMEENNRAAGDTRW